MVRIEKHGTWVPCFFIDAVSFRRPNLGGRKPYQESPRCRLLSMIVFGGRFFVDKDNNPFAATQSLPYMVYFTGVIAFGLERELAHEMLL